MNSFPLDGVSQLAAKFRSSTPTAAMPPGRPSKRVPEGLVVCEFCRQAVKMSNLIRHIAKVHATPEAVAERERQRQNNQLAVDHYKKNAWDREGRNLLRAAQGGLPTLGKDR